MATYFHGSSEIQADGLQTLYLMNPGYVGYSDTQTPANMVFLNHHNPPPQTQQNHHHLVGIPLQSTTTATNSAASSQGLGGRQSSVHAQHEMSAIHGFLPRVHYNLWTSMDQGSQQTHQLTTTSAATANNSNSVGGIASTDVSSQLGLRRSVMPPSQQGLSLSLSPQQTIYGSYRPESEIPAATQAPVISPLSGGGSSSPASGLSNGISGVQSVLFGSKYLKATQQLLEEVVNVRNGLKDEEGSKGVKEQSKMNRDATAATGEGSSVAGGGETSTKRGTDLSTAERQELQMKKAKLVSMLDEVEQRYRQYHHQMQIVVSSFEQATGFGCAKTYTALALQTISKQFRCLKDAISGQIRQSSKSLGEEEYCLGGKTTEGGSRLRFVDHQLRQQRALQQLGMIQHNAWRPQRGLPERSVSVLRAWLFEHFLHPYPKDSDKQMLAKQTGLTRSQVSNWFINARVRLWKPMVEEMYLEEVKEHEQNGGSEDKTSNEESKSTNPQEKSPVGADQNKKLKNSNQDNINPANPNTLRAAISSPSTSTIHAGQGGLISLIGSSSSDVEAGFMQGSPKKSRTSINLQNSSLGSFHASMEMEMDDVKPGETTNRDFCAKFGDDERQSRDGGYSLITGATTHGGGGFGGYSIGELGGRFEVPDHNQFPPRFSGNNGSVSLTLGLPHCENLSLSGTHHQQTYLSNHHNIQLGRRLDQMGSTAEPNDFCGITTPNSHSTATYENINLQNRKRFVAHQLLPDFVA